MRELQYCLRCSSTHRWMARQSAAAAEQSTLTAASRDSSPGQQCNPAGHWPGSIGARRRSSRCLAIRLTASAVILGMAGTSLGTQK